MGKGRTKKKNERKKKKKEGIAPKCEHKKNMVDGIGIPGEQIDRSLIHLFSRGVDSYLVDITLSNRTVRGEDPRSPPITLPEMPPMDTFWW